MRLGIEDTWIITDHFWQRWRATLIPVAERSFDKITPRWELAEDPLFHMIYYSFDDSIALCDEMASDLIGIYDALTDSALGDELPEPTQDPRRILRGFKEELQDVLYTAMEAGVLRFERYEVAWPFPENDEKPPEKGKEAKGKAWIGLELLTKKDAKPVAGASFTLKVPDGTTRSGSLNDHGIARVDGIDAGSCDVDFPDFAPKEWGGVPMEGGGFDYTIQQGDCLASIAKQFHFADWHTIYDAPENADFRKLRPNPNILVPGDQIHIPGRLGQPVSRSTGAQHTFKLTESETRFRVRIKLGVPFTYHLDVDGQSYDASLDDGAIIDVAIQPDARNGKLSVWPNHEKDKDPLEWNIDLGSLDPCSEPTGVQARLNNLGFSCGKVDGIVGAKTERALRAFQDSVGLDPTGKIDKKTVDAIRTHHDI